MKRFIAEFLVEQIETDQDPFTIGEIADDAANQVSLGTERGDERAEDDVARVGHDAGHLGGAAEVFGAIGVGKAQALGKTGAEIVTIELGGEDAAGVETGGQLIGEGGLALTGEAEKPDDVGFLA